MSRRSSARLPRRGLAKQPELSLPARRHGLDPDRAAKLAIARRAKASPVPEHVRLALTLELRRVLAEQLSARAIRTERNIEAVVIALIEEAAKRWR